MINLFINPYIDKNILRQKEIAYCYHQNKSNKNIDKIYELKGRPTFREYFKFINSVTGEDDINIICNSDIYFDETVINATNMRKIECYALTRWDIKRMNPFVCKIYREPGSQDTWIFRGRIMEERIRDCEFILGKMGCDNRIAYELSQAGYIVTNPAFSIKTIHYHLSNLRNYDEKDRSIENVVQPPYKMIPLTKLKHEIIA